MKIRWLIGFSSRKSSVRIVVFGMFRLHNRRGLALADALAAQRRHGPEARGLVEARYVNREAEHANQDGEHDGRRA